MGAGLGAAIGAPTGLGAFGTAMTGSTIGGFADLTIGVMGRREIEAASLGQGLQGIAKHNFGSISQSAGRRMGSMMQDAVYSYEGRATGMDLEQIQRNVLSFDNAGGFSNVTSADEMEDVLEGVVENTRQFANKFKMKQEEAVQVMAQLQSSMVATTENMGEFSSRMSHLGEVTGLGAAGATNFGMQGVDMMRGTGISAAQRFDMALEARTQAERLRYSDPETRQLISDAGGPDGFALRNLERSQRYLNSGQGQLGMLNLLGGGMPGDGIGDIISNVASYYGGDPRKLLEFQNNAAEMAGALGSDFAVGTSVQNAYSALERRGMLNEGGRVSEDLIISTMANQQGISQEAARSIYAQFPDMLNRNPYQDQMMDFYRAREDFAAEHRVGSLSRLGAGISKFFADASTDSRVGFAATSLAGFTKRVIATTGMNMRGEEMVGGIYLTDSQREAYNELRDSGTFEEVIGGPDRTPEQIMAARIRDGRGNIRAATKDTSRRLKDVMGLHDLSDDEVALIAAGSSGTAETYTRLEDVERMGIGSIFGDIVNLSGEVSSDLQSRMIAAKQGDIAGARNEKEELDLISQKVFGVNFSQGTSAQKNATYNRFRSLSLNSDNVHNIISSVRGGDNLNKLDSDARKLDARSQELIDEFDGGFASAIRETNIAYMSDEGGESFEGVFTSALDRNKIERAARRGEWDELDTSEYNTHQREYLRRLQQRTDGLSAIYNKGVGFKAEAQKLRRAKKEARLSGITSVEGVRAIADNLGNRIALQDVGSETKYNLADETGLNAFIQAELEASGLGAGAAEEMVTDLLNPENSYEQFISKFADTASKIDNSQFFTEAAARTNNAVLGHSMLKMEGDDVMTKFKQAIGDGVVRVQVVDSKSGRYEVDPKD